MIVVRFLAILLTALALVPGGAHVLALPNKLSLPKDTYFAVQSIYAGWALLGVVIVAAILADALLALLSRSDPVASRLAWPAVILLAVGLGVFFLFVFPGNQATSNWTVAPADWERLRARWEYGHAANAVLTLIALGCVITAALRPIRPAAEQAMLPS